MIKRLIKKVFERLGYDISLSQDRSRENPFEEQRCLVKSPDNAIIFDVGAHHGETSLLYRQLFPSATIYAFEPFPDSFEELRKNTAGDPKVKVFNIGFSDADGPKPFCFNQSSATNSLFETDDRGAETWGGGVLETSGHVTLPFTTIDRFVAAHNIHFIDILKLDVQGAEYLVLKGAEQCIGASKIGLIYSEIITQPTYKGQKLLHEMLSMFHDSGFSLHSFYDLSCASNGKLRQLDAIFTSTRRD